MSGADLVVLGLSCFLFLWAGFGIGAAIERHLASPQRRYIRVHRTFRRRFGPVEIEIGYNPLVKQDKADS
jgi:hypothetical protein